ncbi:MAG: hypothetical protein NTV34_15220 [Proteobacteria bacterium]|nr:hypothetical protein [Pseudomonadota bacterium]
MNFSLRVRKLNFPFSDLISDSKNFLGQRYVMHDLEGSVSRMLDDCPYQGPAGPWTKMLREAIQFGIDIRLHAETLLKVAGRSDEIMLDVKSLKQGMQIKVTLIFLLCLSARLLLGVLRSDSLHIGQWDLVFLAASVIVSGIVYRAFVRAIPALWTIGNIGGGPSETFMKWCQTIVLDELSPVEPLDEVLKGQSNKQSNKRLDGLIDWLLHSLSQGASKESCGKGWTGLTEAIRQLHQLEMRDGVNRQSQRESAALRWSADRFSESQKGLRQLVLFAPITELTITVLLGLGFCAIPLVDILGGGATMGSPLIGENSYGIQEDHGFSNSTDQSPHDW